MTCKTQNNFGQFCENYHMWPIIMLYNNCMHKISNETKVKVLKCHLSVTLLPLMSCLVPGKHAHTCRTRLDFQSLHLCMSVLCMHCSCYFMLLITISHNNSIIIYGTTRDIIYIYSVMLIY